MTHRRRWRKNRKQKAAARNSKEQQATDYTGSRYCDSIYNKQQQKLGTAYEMYCSESNNSSSRLPYTDKWWRLDTQQEQQFFFCIASAGTRVNNVVITGAAL